MSLCTPDCVEDLAALALVGQMTAAGHRLCMLQDRQPPDGSPVIEARCILADGRMKIVRICDPGPAAPQLARALLLLKEQVEPVARASGHPVTTSETL